MTKEEYLQERRSLERAIAFSERLNCRLVAADRKRRLRKLEEEYKRSSEYHFERDNTV